jgi:L-2-hydroxyglutarate oxidase
VKSHYDVVVVGAGIVGLAVAREIKKRRPDASIAVIEKEKAVALHQTGHNSGVIHGGIYYRPGSLKAQLCARGAELMYAYCDEHRIPYVRSGKLIIAVRDGELGRLSDLEGRGRANGVPGLRRVSAAGIRDIEPQATGISALHAPNTGVVDFGLVAQALASELAASGVDLRFESEVSAITRRGSGAVVAIPMGEVLADRVIVCAGLWSDRLARRAGASADPRIVPFRGAYLTLKVTPQPLVTTMIYPVPDPALPFLGVHITPQVDGRVMLGPTALPVASRTAYRVARFSLRDAWESLSWPGSWRMASRHWRTGLRELRLATSTRAFVAACAEYVPSLSVDDLDGGVRAGIRAQALGADGALIDDFVVTQLGPSTHVRNAPSPAATAAFALAEELVDRVEQAARG